MCQAHVVRELEDDDEAREENGEITHTTALSLGLPFRHNRSWASLSRCSRRTPRACGFCPPRVHPQGAADEARDPAALAALPYAVAREGLAGRMHRDLRALAAWCASVLSPAAAKGTCDL